MFDENSEKAQKIELAFLELLEEMEEYANVSFKDPLHDITRRFLNEIKEFKPLEKQKKDAPEDP